MADQKPKMYQLKLGMLLNTNCHWSWLLSFNISLKKENLLLRQIWSWRPLVSKEKPVLGRKKWKRRGSREGAHDTGVHPFQLVLNWKPLNLCLSLGFYVILFFVCLFVLVCLGFGRISFCLNSFIWYFLGYLNSFQDFSLLGEIPLYRGKYQLPSKNGDFVKIQNSLRFWRWFWPFHHSFLPWLTCSQNFPGHKRNFLLACLPTPHLLYQRHNNELQNPPVSVKCQSCYHLSCAHKQGMSPCHSFPLYINREYTNINFTIAKHPLNF